MRKVCSHRVRGAALAPLAFALFWSFPALAGAPRGSVCLVPRATADGLEATTVQAALTVEARKLGRTAHVFSVRSPDHCPAAPGNTVRVALGPGARAALEAGYDDTRHFDLSEVPPVDRARTVARAALAALETPREDEVPEALIDLGVPIVPPPPPVPLNPGFAVAVGGGYSYAVGPGTNLGVVDGEVAFTLFEGRLSLGLLGTYQPELQVLGGEPTARALSGELNAVVRGGFAVGPFLVRLGLGGGYQWRRVRVASTYRLDEGSASSGAATLVVEPELVWRFASRWTAHLVVPGRVYLGGVSHSWKGRVLNDAPRGAVGLTLRMGAFF